MENACKIGLADKTDWITYQAILWRGVHSRDKWKPWLPIYMRGFKMEKPETTNKPEIYFEDLSAPAQEAIIDLIVSIIKNKRQEADKMP